MRRSVDIIIERKSRLIMKDIKIIASKPNKGSKIKTVSLKTSAPVAVNQSFGKNSIEIKVLKSV